MKAEMTDKEERWAKALREVGDALDEADLPFFLDTGTLLGAVRDKRFIPWDNDIDLGIIKNGAFNEKFQQVSLSLHSIGYSYFRSDKAAYFIRSPDVEIGFMFYEPLDSYYINEFRNVTFTYKWISNLIYLIKTLRSGWIVDYNGHTLGKKIRRLVVKGFAGKKFREGAQFSSAFDLQIKKIKVPREFFDKLERITLYGSEYLAPSPANSYLEVRYGKGWRTPREDYNYFEDDRSAQG